MTRVGRDQEESSGSEMSESEGEVVDLASLWRAVPPQNIFSPGLKGFSFRRRGEPGCVFLVMIWASASGSVVEREARAGLSLIEKVGCYEFYWTAD